MQGRTKCSVKIDIKKMDDDLDRVLRKASSIIPAREPLEIPKDLKVDPFKLITKGLVARTAHSTVYRGVYDAKEVVVKVMNLEDNANASLYMMAFEQEVEIWRTLNHPNILKLVGVGMDCNLGTGKRISYTISEYMPRGTLQSFLGQNHHKRLNLKRVLELAMDLAKGLSYLHSKNIVHRDIKTENLLLDGSERLKIADFGLSHVMSPSDPLTARMGTFGYMAPEVLDRVPYDNKCDVYGFGICLWEMYHRGDPFPNCIHDLDSALADKDKRPEIHKDCPNALAELMRSCWEADPRRRPQMSEVVSALEVIKASEDKSHAKKLGCFCFTRHC